MSRSSGSFWTQFDDELRLGRKGNNRAFFGREVLRGLVSGIDNYAIELKAKRRVRGSATLLACTPWFSDAETAGAIARLPRACVVLTKRPHNEPEREMVKRLRELNQLTPGLPVAHFRELSLLAPREEGRPAVVDAMAGPVGSEFVLPTFRTIGERSSGAGDYPRVAHAKLPLLGRSWWAEDEWGSEFPTFTEERLWVSSANFTYPSRRSLEFGYWTEDPDLMKGTRRFLTRLIEASEDFDAESDAPDPELAMVDVDTSGVEDYLREFWPAGEDESDTW